MTNILDPKTFLLREVSGWHSTYKDYETAQVAVLDSIFNVIGNGFDSDKDLINLISSSENYDFGDFENNYKKDKYIGHFSIIFRMNNGFERELYYLPNEDDYVSFRKSEINPPVEDIFEEEIELYPEAILWVNSNPRKKFQPYPNFQKEYSLIYKINFDLFSDKKEAWKDTLIFFYENCIKHYESEDCKSSMYAYPSANKYQDRATFDTFEQNLKKYKSNEEITKAYGLEYTGDLDDFIKRKWIKTKNEWISFSKEAIKYIKKQ